MDVKCLLIMLQVSPMKYTKHASEINEMIYLERSTEKSLL